MDNLLGLLVVEIPHGFCKLQHYVNCHMEWKSSAISLVNVGGEAFRHQFHHHVGLISHSPMSKELHNVQVSATFQGNDFLLITSSNK